MRRDKFRHDGKSHCAGPILTRPAILTADLQVGTTVRQNMEEIEILTPKAIRLYHPRVHSLSNEDSGASALQTGADREVSHASSVALASVGFPASPPCSSESDVTRCGKELVLTVAF